MEHDNVFYINVKPYIYNFTFQQMVERYYAKHKDLYPDIDEHIFVKIFLAFNYM